MSDKSNNEIIDEIINEAFVHLLYNSQTAGFLKLKRATTQRFIDTPVQHQVMQMMVAHVDSLPYDPLTEKDVSECLWLWEKEIQRRVQLSMGAMGKEQQ